MLFLLFIPRKAEQFCVAGYVLGSPNGKICKSANGYIFTNGNQRTLNVFLVPMVPWWNLKLTILINTPQPLFFFYMYIVLIYKIHEIF